MFPAAGTNSSNPAHTPSSRTVRSTGAQDSQLDVRHMDDRAVFYFAKELASSTIRTYRSSRERFLKYCQSTNSVPFPVTEVVLCGFATHLADVGLKHRSIKTYMSGVRFFFQIKAGTRSRVHRCWLENVMRGIKKKRMKRRQEAAAGNTFLSPQSS